jgi:hypothetical protein
MARDLSRLFPGKITAAWDENLTSPERQRRALNPSLALRAGEVGSRRLRTNLPLDRIETRA